MTSKKIVGLFICLLFSNLLYAEFFTLIDKTFQIRIDTDKKEVIFHNVSENECNSCADLIALDREFFAHHGSDIGRMTGEKYEGKYKKIISLSGNAHMHDLVFEGRNLISICHNINEKMESRSFSATHPAKIASQNSPLKNKIGILQIEDGKLTEGTAYPVEATITITLDRDKFSSPFVEVTKEGCEPRGISGGSFTISGAELLALDIPDHFLLFRQPKDK